MGVNEEDEYAFNENQIRSTSLCSTFNAIFAEANLGDIMEIMKFSLRSPIPFSLKDMAGFNYYNSDEYEVLFPNGGNLSFLQNLEYVFYIIHVGTNSFQVFY